MGIYRVHMRLYRGFGFLPPCDGEANDKENGNSNGDRDYVGGCRVYG